VHAGDCLCRDAGKTIMTILFPATRSEGQRRLSAFVPRAGRDYASGRNTDNGPDGHAHVSLLSPYLRLRLVTEREVVQAVLAKHSLSSAEKYVQEVLWRTYWKGWLEMRPSIWTRFTAERDQMQDNFPNVRAITAAETGMTGIDGFDDWARELIETGYLHNHARMWFASIWIFTLRLPWTLGADFFLRHLIDADPASNTLSWRWVAGLQTAGKTYLATADNIARFTGGRFSPKGLAKEATALTEPPIEAPVQIPKAQQFDPHSPAFLLVTPEDMSTETLFPASAKIDAAMVVTAAAMSCGGRSAGFAADAEKDTADRIKAHYRCAVSTSNSLDASALIGGAQAIGARQIVTSYAPVGSTADALNTLTPLLATEGISLLQIQRPWDTHFWPHAQKGFFPFKEHIAAGLAAEGIAAR
jgi:deoxyribodipyrimidine photo-lyase